MDMKVPTAVVADTVLLGIRGVHPAVWTWKWFINLRAEVLAFCSLRCTSCSLELCKLITSLDIFLISNSNRGNKKWGTKSLRGCMHRFQNRLEYIQYTLSPDYERKRLL